MDGQMLTLNIPIPKVGIRTFTPIKSTGHLTLLSSALMMLKLVNIFQTCFNIFKPMNFQFGKVEPPATGGFWELGEWHETTMESPWRFAENPKMAPFDQQVCIKKH
jgi:hypothetical protein